MAPGTPPAHSPFAELADRLRGLPGQPPGGDTGVTARELAEALWLARHVPPARVRAHGAGSGADGPVDGHGGSGGHGAGEGGPQSAASPLETAREAGEGADTARLHSGRPPAGARGARTPGTGLHGRAMPVRAPSATALPHALPLQRALRPLQGYQPPVRTPARRLDEQATAERAAETGLLLPVLRTTERREARLQLVMDLSSSTVLWQGALAELAAICAVTGAFSEVHTQYLSEGPDGTLVAAPDREGRRPARRAEQLRDGTGRQLTLVLSDCAGPLWRAGRMQRLLHHWAGAAPVALVQPLPQRMWARTHLPARPGVLRRREGRGARLEFTPAREAPPAYAERALPVPVLGLHQDALHTWARLISGSTGLSQPGAAAWVRPDHPSAGPRPPAPEREAADLLRGFRRGASREAVQLAVCLSAAPLALPVMQLVQRTMLPDTGPAVLAEVVLSGLLRRAEGAPEGEYAFAPGVQEQLLRSLPKGEAVLVLKHVSEYVERRFGRGERNFAAYAVARLTGGLPTRPAADPGTALVAPADTLPPAFAEVPASVVRRFGLGAQQRDTGERDTGERAPDARSAGERRVRTAVRRTMVRLENEGFGPDLNGFFVAPEWVVTTSRGGWSGPEAVVVTASGERLRGDRVEWSKTDWQRDLALFHVPGAEEAACLWMADLPPRERMDVSVHGWSEGRTGDGPEFVSSVDRLHAPRAGTVGLPPDGPAPYPGAPVLDAATGEVIGVLTEAGPYGGRWTPLPTVTRKDRIPPWSALVRAHDLHHAKVLGRTGGEVRPGRTTSSDEVEQAPAASAFDAVRRVRLYGILAQLTPPYSADVVRNLMEQVTRILPASRTRRGNPANWRDGAALLSGSYDTRPGRDLEAVALFAAHVWAATGESGPQDVREEVRDWAESIGRGMEFEPAREAVARVLRSRAVQAPGRGTSDPCALVEVTASAHEPQRYHWAVRLRHGDGLITATDASTSSVPVAGLEESLAEPLTSVLRLGDIGEERTDVRFSLPPELFDLPVDEWRTVYGGSLRGAGRHVTLCAHGRGQSLARTARWTGIHRARVPGLEPVGLLPSGVPLAALRDMLRGHASHAVPVHAGQVSGGRAALALETALEMGYGLVLWCRDPDDGAARHFEQHASDLVRGSRDADDVLRRVRRVRTLWTQGSAEARWAAGLAVLHDPADLDFQDSWPLPSPRLRRRGE